MPSSWGLLLLLAIMPWLPAAERPATRSFNLPADTAEKSLKAFSEQSGRGVIFVTDVVRGVRTNSVIGNFTPDAALATLLHGTGLVSAHDPATGAFAVRRQTPEEAKNVHRAAQKTICDRPSNPGLERPKNTLPTV